MSTSQQTEPTTDADIERRIALTFQFMREVIADPSRLDEIPASGSVVVILPADDPEFAARERAFADRLATEGRHVVVVTVGAEPISDEGWQRLNAKPWAPTWAAELDRDRAAIVYDQERDVLLVDFSRGRRQGWSWPHNDLTYLLIDEETEEAFGYLVLDFLGEAVHDIPGLARALRIADVRSLNAAERAQVATMSIWHFEGSEPTAPSQSAIDARADFMSALYQLADKPVVG